MAAPLSLSHGTLVRRSTPVENHCFKVYQGLRLNLGKRTKMISFGSLLTTFLCEYLGLYLLLLQADNQTTMAHHSQSKLIQIPVTHVRM